MTDPDHSVPTDKHVETPVSDGHPMQSDTTKQHSAPLRLSSQQTVDKLKDLSWDDMFTGEHAEMKLGRPTVKLTPQQETALKAASPEQALAIKENAIIDVIASHLPKGETLSPAGRQEFMVMARLLIDQKVVDFENEKGENLHSYAAPYQKQAIEAAKSMAYVAHDASYNNTMKPQSGVTAEIPKTKGAGLTV